MVSPSDQNRESMGELLRTLFPMYRSLCGPGPRDCLLEIQKRLPIEIAEFPTGRKVFDWVIPKEFRVNHAYVEGPDGKRYLDFADCNHHVWLYSRPFKGEMDRDELVTHIATKPELPDAVPLKHAYYRDMWGLAASENQVRALPPGRYKIDIDTEHLDGALRIGQYYLPGETDDEIMLTSYLCHPLGANDNVSGVVISVELFKLLAQLPRRRYSYRLAIWPETIGSVTYIASYPERIAKVKGGYVITCAGDGGTFTYKRTHAGNSLIDRAALHALTHAGVKFEAVPYRHDYGSDECQFNAIGLRLPFGSIMRTMYGFFPEYHSSADDLTVVTPEYLHQTLQVYWAALMAIERAVTYKGTFTVDPFLTGHGIFPWDEGAGASGIGTAIARAYYHLMGGVDGRSDLLAIADAAGENIRSFDRAVGDFLRTGLMSEVR